ncbi:hypothetical protein ACXM2N_01280 [Corynebacterium sp. ZY180755]
MEFSTHPPKPLEFGKSIDDLASRISNPFRRDLISMETLRGTAYFNGDARQVKIIFKEGLSTECEILVLEPGDTFLGIPVPMRATKFQNELKKRDIPTKKESGVITITDTGVSFYVFEGEIATIGWTATDSQTENPDSTQNCLENDQSASPQPKTTPASESTNFTVDLPLPFKLGGTVEENIALLDDYFFNKKGSGTDLEGFLVIDDDGVEEEVWKIVSIIEDDKCVTARVDFNNENVTFLGVPIGPDNSLPVEETAQALEAKGLKVITQEYGLVLPDHYITIEPGDFICYWDQTYWSQEEFLAETVEPED